MLADRAKGLFRKNKNPSSSVEDFWALKNINFDVQSGEVIGIIGRNGAGKSTLLKILSRISEPSTGRITLRGRIASLLEVGTGFHPELSGRENVFLNGAILGMSQQEIRRKFDEIVAFAEVEQFLDTPVKRYSSGMYVRLAFAVAAHLEPEILIVDEVLAVGDMQFQKKCLGKMENVAGEGRTVLFVSHNMGTIKALCKRGILLKKGEIAMDGRIEPVISAYMALGASAERCVEWTPESAPRTPEIVFSSVKVLDKEGGFTAALTSTQDLFVEISYELLSPIKFFRLILLVQSHDGVDLFESSDIRVFDKESDLRPAGSYVSRCRLPGNFFNLSSYKISIAADVPGQRMLLELSEEITFSISELYNNQLGVTRTGKPAGVIHPTLDWSVKKL
ncbi:MAG: transporter ATP-binding protein [Verrucomicrobiales bacterium]|nr:transporter ATP-binding protein [Verrucomicrobiales bacterium]MDB6129969.1 transporter ATP-binding protein [Verrucomicrobiales bacterium]